MTDAISPLRARIGRRLAYLSNKWWFWIAIMAFPFSWPFYYAGSRDMPPVLMTYGQVPQFDLVDQYGDAYGSDDLEGRVWVAAFFFTRCKTVCPRIMEQMGKIQHRGRHLGPAFQIVGFSVDPDHDTPQVLREYASSYRASRTGWTLLTGPTAEIQNVVVQGLRIAAGSQGNETDHEYDGIFHGTHFVLVDAKMRIRGYYDSNDDDRLSYLLRDAGIAVNRGG